MRCPKCKVISMHDDTDRVAGIQVYACYACGNRVYAGYPIRGPEREEPGIRRRRRGPTSALAKRNNVVAFSRPLKNP